jgi:hypothetical protein
MPDTKGIEDTAPKSIPLSEGIKYESRRGASAFSNKYNVDQYSYPFDLLSSKDIYGRNYVIFYINVQVDSKLGKQTNEDLFVKEFEPRDRGDLVGQNLDRTTLFAANAGLNAGGALLGQALGVGGASATVAGLATVGAAATANYAATASRAQKRLKTAIALHIPNQLNIRYGMQWSEEDTLAMSMATSGIEEILKATSSGGKIKDLADPAQAMVTNLMLSKGPNAGANSAATGLAANPKKEQVFKGVDFRTFQFEYQFFPRDSDEAKNIQRIIKEFKYHMHPEFKDANNFVYIYPSEFDIFYYQGGAENLNLHRHTSCVLTELSVNYTPNGNFSTFDDGMPTQINIQMSFRELALLTKDKIQDGL